MIWKGEAIDPRATTPISALARVHEEVYEVFIQQEAQISCACFVKTRKKKNFDAVGLNVGKLIFPFKLFTHYTVNSTQLNIIFYHLPVYSAK